YIALKFPVLGHDRLLALVTADGRARDLDADLVGDLHLDGLVVHFGDLSVNAARGDYLVADLERFLEFLNFLLAAFHRHEEHEIEDADDQRDRHETYQSARALAQASHCNYVEHGLREKV